MQFETKTERTPFLYGEKSSEDIELDTQSYQSSSDRSVKPYLPFNPEVISIIMGYFDGNEKQPDDNQKIIQRKKEDIETICRVVLLYKNIIGPSGSLKPMREKNLPIIEDDLHLYLIMAYLQDAELKSKSMDCVNYTGGTVSTLLAMSALASLGYLFYYIIVMELYPAQEIKSEVFALLAAACQVTTSTLKCKNGDLSRLYLECSSLARGIHCPPDLCHIFDEACDDIYKTGWKLGGISILSLVAFCVTPSLSCLAFYLIERMNPIKYRHVIDNINLRDPISTILGRSPKSIDNCSLSKVQAELSAKLGRDLPEKKVEVESSLRTWIRSFSMFKDSSVAASNAVTIEILSP